MKRKKYFLTCFILLLKISCSTPLELDYNYDQDYVDQANDTETEAEIEMFRRNDTTAEFVVETITKLWNFFKSENNSDTQTHEEEPAATLEPDIEDTTPAFILAEDQEKPLENETPRFLFPLNGNEINEENEGEKPIEQCTGYVTNRHFVLEANKSLELSLESWTQRSIVQTESSLDITAQGSCLVFGLRDGSEIKPTFSNNDFIRRLSKNITVSAYSTSSAVYYKATSVLRCHWMT